jgi:hypothetical protein
MRIIHKVLAVAALLSAVCTLTSAQTNDPCSICPNDLTVSNPDTVIPDGTAGIVTEDTTCADLEEQAQNGDFSAASCLLLRTRVTEDCCGEPTVTEAPAATTAPTAATTTAPTATPTTLPPPEATPAPTTAPIEGTVAPTLAATEAPSVLPPSENVTEAPGPAPIGDSVQGFVAIRLDQVPGELSGGILDEYLDSCKKFFDENLEDSVVRLSVELFNQTVVSTEERLRRRLQTLKAVDTVLLVSGTASTQELNSSAFEESLPGIVNDNATGFIETIQSSDSSDFFANVTTVDAFDPNSPPTSAPSAAPAAEENDDKKLSGGAIFGIVFGVLVAIVAIVALAKVAQQKGEMHGTPRQLDAGTPSPSELKMSEPKASVKKSKTVVVAAAAAADLEEGRDQDSDAAVAESNQGVEPSGILATMDQAPEENEEEKEAEIQVEPSVSAVKKSSSVARSVTSSTSVASTLRQNMVSREVVAPPGKLGIVVDTTVEGPVVHKVSEGSPLEGKLFPGDIIISIDGVNTRAMSAAAITQLMVRNAEQDRTMVVLSEEAS